MQNSVLVCPKVAAGACYHPTAQSPHVSAPNGSVTCRSVPADRRWCLSAGAVAPCCPLLQRVHKFEVMVTRKAEGREGRAFIGNMTEEKSVELASKLASESFLFAVSRCCTACG